jgi:hypothetical protein
LTGKGEKRQGAGALQGAARGSRGLFDFEAL